MGTICGAMLARHCEPVAWRARIIIGARGADWRDAVFHQRHALRAGSGRSSRRCGSCGS
ncbi:MAG: hypothetical protein R3F43_08105 [bacterium]